MSYIKFGTMIFVSTIIMFGLMYLNTYSWDHVFLSQTRAWMAIIMGAAMAIVMLVSMWRSYEDERIKAAIIIGSLISFSLALWLVRTQETVDDLSYMKAMIPHHSIAIMTSTRAHIKDPRVRKLADGIIEAQVREINEMKKLIAVLEQSPPPRSAQDISPAITP